ncbi:MAG: rRNA methyltransferase [Bacteroidota bacterium]
MIFPPSFISRIQSQFGSESKPFFDSLKKEPPVSIRINPEKKISFGDSAIPWCSTGFYLDKRPSFTLDPLFHAGCYYVQDASSMFLEQVFVQLGLSEKKLLLLDACAAPGGKSTHLASLMSKNSLLISNEVIGSRISVLKENTIKWGNPNVMITNNDPSAFSQLENLFDVILVDAPCSGEGLFRKDHDALEQWSESNCEISAARQQRILTSLLPSLKPGGYLIYSTCTYNPKENEDHVKWLCENENMEFIPLEVKAEWGIKILQEKNKEGIAFLPHKVKGEGLFISVLRKNEEPFSSPKIKSKSSQFLPLSKKFESLHQWLNDGKSNYSLVQRDEMVFAIHKEWLPLVELLSGHLRIVHSGTCIAELKGDKAIPTHEIAMSSLLNKDAFISVDVNEETALRYLRKEDFKIESIQKGYSLITYLTHPLGFINFLGNRFNNYYPSNWRIRMK